MGRRATTICGSRAAGTVIWATGAPEREIAKVWIMASSSAPARATSSRSMRKNRSACGASWFQSTSTTPGVVASTFFTRRAVSCRRLSWGEYTSATKVDITGGPGGISATLAAAP